MKLTPLQKRAERKARNNTALDMNLVALIDIFTILIFFLLSGASGVELLPSPKAVKLPASTAEQSPKETIVVIVSEQDILVDGRKVASVAEVMARNDDLIEPLKAELELLGGRQAVRAENQAKSKSVTIMGDQSIPYRLLRKVMYSSARANFSDVSFAVRRRDGV
ncbi:ExbD/TolR family protein [Rivibacter subsaxonicus]|uniref:Biopolymer transport protein ExbD n=1 Tax=Rivibacter subsaxonicus TaxID=457575 RepID=A0A4Q7W0Z4_9BURK|nr:biopolymer transporter ExbD [Rivibacter subsaxonicus]RZU02790.1 biopolymer transport protein ExbD [Rivibacter subsaxonicus]